MTPPHAFWTQIAILPDYCRLCVIQIFCFVSAVLISHNIPPCYSNMQIYPIFHRIMSTRWKRDFHSHMPTSTKVFALAG